MAESGVAYISIVPVSQGVSKQIAKEIDGSGVGRTVGGQMSKGILASAANVAKQAGQIISGTIAAGAGVAAAAAAGKGLSRLLQIEDATAKLRGLGNTAEDVEAIMSSALNAVRGTAFGMGEAATVAASAVAAGIRPGQELENYLKLTADAATIAGVSLSEMGSIINKTTTSGKVFTDNLNQLADRGIPIFQWLQEEYGVTAEGLSEMVAKGEVDSATFRKVIEENIGGAALESGNTTRGAFDNMLAALGRVGANLLGGVFPAFKTVFSGITTALEPIETTAKNVGATIGQTLTPLLERAAAGFSNILPTLASIGPLLGPLAGLFSLVAVSGLGPLVGSLPLLGGLGEALKGIVNPFTLVAVALAGLIAASPALQSALSGLGGGLVAAFQPLGAEVGPALSGVLPLLNELVTALGGALASAITTLTPALVALAPAIVAVVAAAVPLVTGLVEGLTWLLNLMSQNSTATLAFVSAIAGGVVAFKAYQGILAAIRIATIVWAAAQAILNVALTANPIGIIIVAIGALVAAIIWIATQTTFFQDVWASFTTGLAIAWEWLWGSVLKPGIDSLVAAFQAVVGFLQPVFDWFAMVINGIVAVFTWWITNITIPLINGVVAVFQWLVAAVTPVFQIIGALIQIAGALFVWLYNNAVKPAIDWIVGAIELFALGVQIMWATYVQPAIDAVGAAFMWVYNSVIKPVVDWVRNALTVFGLAVQLLWATYVQPAINAIGAAFNWVWQNVIKPVADFISNAVNTVGETVGRVFGVMGSVISGAFNGVVETVRSIFNSVIDLVNGAIRGIDSVISTVGGALGVDVNISTIPRLAKGGIVSRRQGGILANIGEGRYDEAVVPLGGPQLDRLRDALMDNRPTGGGTRDINVYTSDPYVAAELVSQRLASRSEF